MSTATDPQIDRCLLINPSGSDTGNYVNGTRDRDGSSAVSTGSE